MTKSHLKRLFAPKTWRIKRKNITFILRPNPGAHTLKTSFPIKLALIDLNLAQTSREARYILKNHKVLVNNKQVKDIAYPLGLFDILSFPELKENYIVLLDKKEKIRLVKTKLNNLLLKLDNKKQVRGNKTQLIFHSGRTLLIPSNESNNYSIGDSFLFDLKNKKIIEHIKLEKGSKIYLFRGRHVGHIAEIIDFKGTQIFCKIKEFKFETKTKYAFAINNEIEKIISSLQ